jgi:glycosyltransferase involved in cell wall biosynthesis
MKSRRKNVVILRSSDVMTGPEYYIMDLATQLQYDKDFNYTLICLWKNSQHPLPLFEEAQKIGLDVKRIDSWGRFNFLIIKKLLKFIRKNRIALIHTIGYKADAVGIAAGKLAKVPVISFIPGFVESDYRRRVYNLCTLFLARYFDRIIACSDSVARTVSLAGVRRNKLTTIRNCVSLERCRVSIDDVERIKREFGVSDGYQVVVNLGRLDPEKGQVYLLQAAKEVLAKRKKVIFIIIGNGKLKRKLENTAIKLGIEKKVIFTGYRNDAQAIQAIASIVTFPSLKEGIPLAMLQGMALGKPVVASSVDGIPEVIVNGVNGYLVSPRDYRGLAAALEKLLSNSELLTSLGQEAQKTVEKEYGMKVLADKLKQIYDQVLAERCINKI